MPLQSRTPIIVTAQPIVEQPPETQNQGNAATGVLACLVAGALFAIPVFALAVYVSAKV